jgi:mRNA interferase MazF
MVKKKNTAPTAGGIYKVSLDPTLGHEQRGYRPVLVVSPLKYNSKSGLALACTITSQLKGYPFEVQLSAGKLEGAVLVDQVRALDWRARKFLYIDKLDEHALEEVRAKLLALLN